MEFIIIGAFMIALFTYFGGSEKRAERRQKRREEQEEAEILSPAETPTFRLRIGQEKFSPVLAEGRRYKVSFIGTFFYYGRISDRNGGGISGRIEADALYDTKGHGSFVHRYHTIKLDSQPVKTDPWKEDRVHHRYTYLVTGKNKRLSIFLDLPNNDFNTNVIKEETLTVTVEPLTAYDQALLGAQERDTQHLVDAKQLERWERRLRALADQFEEFDCFDDDEWLETHAKNNQRSLTDRRSEITDDHKDLHADPAFIDYVKENDLGTYRRATWEYRALAIATRLGSQQPPPPPPRKKPTVEEFRKKKTGRIKVRAEDKREEMKERIEQIQQAKADLDGYDLDPDERQALEREIIADILRDDDEESTNGTASKTI